MIVTIHQPEHMPWLGFFDKLRQADVYVMLDNVQYRKNYFHNRNRIRNRTGMVWLTVPALTRGKFGQALLDVEINDLGSPRWREKCWLTLSQSYRRAPYFEDHAAFFEALYKRTDWNRLVPLNEAIIRYLLDAFAIPVRVVRASGLGVTGQKGELILALCRKLGATEYLSGISGRDYLDCQRFEQHGIRLVFHEFHHPIYRQLHQPFIPCMSAIDLLFNYGPASLDVIKGVGVETMDQVFH